MGKRRDPRVLAKLEVRIAGIDASGRPLMQAATTHDISLHGALLEGIQGTLKAGEVISIRYKENKARFRVAWAGAPGTDRAGQIGVETVEPSKCIWDAAVLPPPGSDAYAPKTRERRQHERVPCKLGAELLMKGASAPVRVVIQNISVGGCYVPMPTLPPESSGVKIVIWANEVKLALQGVIASRRPGFGISIKFTETTPELKEKLEHLVQSHMAARDLIPS
jgi:hypothetical protein